MPIYKSLTQEEIVSLMKVFGIEQINAFTQLSGGWANSNYQLTTKELSYVLTVCETKTANKTQQLIKTLRHLEKNGFQTSKCYPTKKGKDIAFWNNKPVILKSFIEGNMCTALSPQLAFLLGKQIAALHLIPSTNFLSQSHAYGIEAFRIFRKEFVDAHPFRKWIEEMEAYIRPFLSDTLPKCMIHGDIFNDNLIITPNESLIIMDFEESCHYYRVYDLGMTIVGTCFENGHLNQDLVKNLFAGYSTKIKLTIEELRAINPFVVYAAASTALWRFKQFNILFPDEKLKDHYKEMSAIAEGIYKNGKFDFVNYF